MFIEIVFSLFLPLPRNSQFQALVHSLGTPPSGAATPPLTNQPICSTTDDPSQRNIDVLHATSPSGHLDGRPNVFLLSCIPYSLLRPGSSNSSISGITMLFFPQPGGETSTGNLSGKSAPENGVVTARYLHLSPSFPLTLAMTCYS